MTLAVWSLYEKNGQPSSPRFRAWDSMQAWLNDYNPKKGKYNRAVTLRRRSRAWHEIKGKRRLRHT